jgi:type 1 glutamine amidotransferase
MKPRTLFQTVGGLAGTIALTLSVAHAEPQVAAAKKKIVFVAGKASHGPGQHEHRAGCMLFADQLNKSGLPVETVVTTNGWPQDESIFDGAAAVVIYSDGGKGHPAMANLDTLQKLTKQGVGIGCIHYAVEIPVGKPGDVLLGSIGGFFEIDWSVNPTWEGSFKIPTHPVTSGIHDFTVTDEWYYHMRFQPEMKGVTPILSTLPPESTLTRPNGPHEGNPAVRAAVLERKESQTTMWVYQRPEADGGGRGFGYTGGHYHKNWVMDDPRRLVLNSIVWIAGLEVPKDGVPSKTPTEEEMTANLDAKGKR